MHNLMKTEGTHSLGFVQVCGYQQATVLTEVLGKFLQGTEELHSIKVGMLHLR